jgi:hypothetical protein
MRKNWLLATKTPRHEDCLGAALYLRVFVASGFLQISAPPLRSLRLCGESWLKKEGGSRYGGPSLLDSASFRFQRLIFSLPAGHGMSNFPSKPRSLTLVPVRVKVVISLFCSVISDLIGSQEALSTHHFIFLTLD